MFKVNSFTFPLLALLIEPWMAKISGLVSIMEEIFKIFFDSPDSVLYCADVLDVEVASYENSKEQLISVHFSGIKLINFLASAVTELFKFSKSSIFSL